MTTSTAKKLFRGTVPTTAGSADYTVPAATTTILKTIELCNTTGQIINIRIHVINSGDSADATNALVYNLQLYPSSQGGGWSWQGAIVMDAGDFIQIWSNVSGITAHISGVEIS